MRDPARAAADSLSLSPRRARWPRALCAAGRWRPPPTLLSRCAWPARCSRPAACASTADDASSPRVLPPPLAGGHHGFESRTGAGVGWGWGGRRVPRAGAVATSHHAHFARLATATAGGRSWSLHPVTSPPLRAALLRQCSSHGERAGCPPTRDASRLTEAIFVWVWAWSALFALNEKATPENTFSLDQLEFQNHAENEKEPPKVARSSPEVVSRVQDVDRHNMERATSAVHKRGLPDSVAPSALSDRVRRLNNDLPDKKRSDSPAAPPSFLHVPHREAPCCLVDELPIAIVHSNAPSHVLRCVRHTHHEARGLSQHNRVGSCTFHPAGWADGAEPKPKAPVPRATSRWPLAYVCTDAEGFRSYVAVVASLVTEHVGPSGGSALAFGQCAYIHPAFFFCAMIMS